MAKTIAAYGGGFKPPTAGHFKVVKRALEEFPEIDELTIYVGGGERDGITQAESILIWEIYQTYLPMKVKIEPSKAPIGDIIRLGKNNPQDEVYFVIGAREKNEGDLKDIESRTKGVKEKYPNMQIKVISTPGGGMSGTNARKAAKVSAEEFYKYIPTELKDEEKQEVYDIVKPVINESLLPSVSDIKDKLKDLTAAVKQQGGDAKKALVMLLKTAKGEIDLTDDDKAFIKLQLKDALKSVGFAAIFAIPAGSLVLLLLKAIKLHSLVTPSAFLNENATYSKDIDIIEKCAQLTNYMRDKGYNIDPLPAVEFINGDNKNAKDFFGKTAYYDPNEQKIVLYTEGRHPKDIVRSFAHEMIHHIQNLEGRLNNITTTNTQEDDHLNNIEAEANLKGTMTFRNWTDSLQEKKNKDPFGLNQYARELAQGLEEIFINEGVYDSIVSKLSKDILNAWKKQFDKDPKRLFALLDTNYELEDAKGRPLEFDFLAKLDFKKTKDRTYKVDGGANEGDDESEGFIALNFSVDPRELPRMWSTIAMDIRDVLRHEIEHLTQGGWNVRQDKQMEDDQTIRDLIQKYKLMAPKNYFMLDKEVDAMLQGMYFKAKKSRRPFADVIEDYLDMVGLEPGEKEEIKTRWRGRLKALSLPLFEELEEMEYEIYSDMDGVITDFDAQFMKASDGIRPSEYERNMGKDGFWKLVDGKGVGFWVGMPWMPDGKQYWDYIKEYNPILLSSPSRSETSRLGKRLWVRNQLPGTKLILAQAKDKQNYARKNRILIDDRPSNIEEWRSQGGIGILHTSALNTIRQLKELGL
jgi:hypothetical protein